MRSIKPGRGPSFGVAALSLFAAVFGIFWIIMAVSITSSAPKVSIVIKILFPLFGVCFVLLAVLMFFYSLHNATGKNRFSQFDITSPKEESDPLDSLLGTGHSQTRRPTSDKPEETVEDKLRELDDLKSKNLVTDAEYTTQRQRILELI